MAAVVPVAGAVAVLLAPMASHKLRRRVAFIWGPYAIGMLTVLGMMYSPIRGFWFLLPLTGLTLNTPFVIAELVIPADMVPREHLGAATGLIMTVGYFAALLGPWVSGAVWDVTGSVTGVMTSLVIAYLAGIIIALFVPEPFPRSKKTLIKPVRLEIL